MPTHSGNMAQNLHLALGQIMSNISFLMGIDYIRSTFTTASKDIGGGEMICN
jgi:hypothetical protein